MVNQPLAKILIADDEPLYARTTRDLLRRAGFECQCVCDAESAIKALSSDSFDLILSDLNMPGNLKLELLHESRKNWPHIPLIVVTGMPSLPTAIESVRMGISDYLLKPVAHEDLLASVRRALAMSPNRPPGADGAAAEPDEPSRQFPKIIGECPKLVELFEIIDRVAHTNANILITGESGTGKEVVARTIHEASSRSKNNFQVIDCTAIPESLFESVLFGHRKGSFTGAIDDQAGLLTQCNHGTAFFDEIGELPATLQAKLLRLVQEQSFTPVGKSAPIQVDTRFICATNRDLAWEVNSGHFRRDLFYRLAVIHIELPPLRDRGNDKMLLADHFLKTMQAADLRVERFSDDVRSAFDRYAWPGNIRELRNVVERALVLTRGRQIEMADLPPALRQDVPVSHGVESNSRSMSSDSLLGARNDSEHEYLISLLKEHRGNVSEAARQAGLSRQGIHKLLRRHGILAADYRG